jgi:hypothetical protein
MASGATTTGTAGRATDAPGPRAAVRPCQTTADLAGLAALDQVLVPGATEPIPAFLAERLLPAPGLRS